MTTPDWTVQLVSDDVCCTECAAHGPAPRTPRDASPGDFGYTIGLHDRGLPELHLWARPTEGDDPGVDWHFSPRDLHRILDDLATDLVAGRLIVGETRTETYDGGATSVTFRLGGPVDPGVVDAFGAAPGARVVPVGWSLRRPPPGALGPADPEVVAALAEVLVDMAPRPGAATVLPPRWRDDDLAFDPSGDFGPLSPMVRGLAAAVLGGGEAQLARFLLDLASGCTTGCSAGWVLALARAAARPVGREPALDRLTEDVGDLVDRLRRGPRRAASWRAVVAEVTDEMGGGWPGDVEALAALLQQGLLALLSTAVVLDVAEGDLLHAGTGPYLWSREEGVGAPPEMVAPDVVLQLVAETTRGLTPERLGRVLAVHRTSLGRDDYRDAAAHLQGLRVVTPVGLGRLGTVLPTEVVDDLAARGRVPAVWDLMSLVVAAVGSAASGTAPLGEEAAEAFCAPYDALLPGLGVLVRRPGTGDPPR